MIYAQEFAEFVKRYEMEHAAHDKIYTKAVNDFKVVKLGELSDFHVKSILRPSLLKWGRMGRVLGYRGCDRIAEKLRELAPQFSEFQTLTLASIDIRKRSDKIETLYNDLLNAKWKSDKNKTKRVGPTATAKLLHLTIPDLFMIWDRKIRLSYGFRESGAGYIRFLAKMQRCSRKLGPVLENLSSEYGKSIPKLIDEYNWKKCWG
jgi:hypothetical protein